MAKPSVKAQSTSYADRIYVIQLTGGCATWSALICRSFGLSTLWTLNLYCIARSLRHISVTDMAILLCILPPYEYLFSWILVPKKFVAFRTIRRNLVDDIPISRVTAFYGFLGSIIFHEVSLLVNGTAFCRLQVLTIPQELLISQAD
ncbi:hypothetical protein TSMEX_011135 [Taenia solium]|eukprot:TsM_000878400 transcript=TsM_000878400 gene=TsM_000878400